MADKGASVLARLRNKAKETGRSNQLCMQLFCQEEFLRRLEKSKYADNFVFKGGLFLYILTEFDSRVTVDVDFMLRKIPNTPEKLREVIGEIIAADTKNDFITFEIKGVSLQLSEIAKLTYIFAGAATLDRLFKKRNIALFIVLTLASLGLLAYCSDFGTAAIFFSFFSRSS